MISKLFKAITLAKCVLTILELNWNQRFWDNKTKLNIFIVCSRRSHNYKTGHFTSWKERECLRNVKNENCTCKACNIVFHLSNMQIYDVLVQCRRRRGCLSSQKACENNLMQVCKRWNVAIITVVMAADLRYFKVVYAQLVSHMMLHHCLR